MKPAKTEVLAASAWLKEQLAARGPKLSGSMVAAAATKAARTADDPVVIHQQQIDAVKNSTEDKGPAKLPTWWRHVRKAFDVGYVDEMLNAPRKAPERSERKAYDLVDSDGRVVGKIVLYDE